MPFPQDPLPLYVDIAPGASPAASLETWDAFWKDITDDVRVAQNVIIEEGIPDEANQADPGTCTLTLDNRSGNYSPRNPAGQWYGKLAKNTPLRVRLQRGRDTFQRVTVNGWGVSDSGFTWSNAGMTYLSTDGTRGIFSANGVTSATGAGSWDFDMTGGVAINALPGVGNYAVATVNFRRASTTNRYQFRVDVEPDNTMTAFLIRTVDNVSTTLSGEVALGGAAVVANRRYNFRLKAEGGFLAAKIWDSTGAEPADWLLLASGEGAYTMDNTDLSTGIQIQRSSVGAPLTTHMYWYDITINSYPFVGTVVEWPVRWDKSGNDSTTSLKATGVLRRLQQGQSPIRSPLYSYIDNLNPIGLWMLEDESGAQLAASAKSGVKGATLYQTSAAGWNGVPLNGTSGQFTVGVDTTIAGTLPRVVPSGAWLAWFVFYMPVLPVINSLIFRVRASGTVSTWDLMVSASFGGVIYLVGQEADGTVLVNQSIPYVPGQWVVGQMEIQQTGGSFTGRIVQYGIGDGLVAGSTSAPVAGAMGAPLAWSIYGSTGFQESAAGPVAFWPRIPSVPIPDLLAAARGFAGESAADRIVRLADERGVRLDLQAGGQSSLMGPQVSDTLLNLIGEAAETDIGLLTEFRGGLRYRTRGRRYGQNVRMTLDMSLGQVSEPPEPTDDDRRLRNDVTVSRRNGSSARAYDSDNIALNGLYDTSVELNAYSDDDLAGQATFRLYLGTWDEMRWPSITMNLARLASVSGMLERATSLDPGSYIRLSNVPTNLQTSGPRLLVESIKQTMGPYEWSMELTCGTYTPWRIPVIEAAGVANDVARVSLVGSTLGSVEAASTPGAVDTWTITNAGRDWDSTSVPYTWDVNGEIVTCTAITGTGTQTATVTRGAQGMTKAHAIGEPVILAFPFYVAL